MLAQGKFESVNEFVAAAIESQIVLESKPLDQAEELNEGSLANSLDVMVSNAMESDAGVLQLSIPRTPPALEKLRGETSEDIAWGLYNRIFPVKITVRVLSQMMTEKNSNVVDLKILREDTTLRAREVAHILGANRREKAPRSERLFTGLPFRRSDKSAERFKNMFVGSVSKAGKAEGFPPLLGFIILKREDGKPVATLTDAGYAFARLKNPILDHTPGSGAPTSTLSKEEADFYISHIKRVLPREWELSSKVLEQVGEGVNTTEGIDQVVQKTVHDLKPPLVPPTRSGVISRLGELGLVQRRQDGIKVLYALTERGEVVLKSIQLKKASR